MVFTNPVATAELPEVNEPEKPHSDGEAMLGHSSAPSIGHSRVSFAIVSKWVLVRNHSYENELQIKLIFIRKDLLEDSFWNIGTT